MAGDDVAVPVGDEADGAEVVVAQIAGCAGRRVDGVGAFVCEQAHGVVDVIRRHTAGEAKHAMADAVV